MQQFSTLGARLLRDAPNMVVSFGCDVLDSALNITDTLSGGATSDLVSGTVKRTMDANIHGTCSLQVARKLEWGRVLLRPWVRLHDAADITLSERWNTGVYAVTTPTTVTGESVITYSVEGFDRLYLLDRLVGDTYSVGAGVKYLDAIRAVVAASGVPVSTILLDTTAAATTVPTALTWPLVKPKPTAADSETSEVAQSPTSDDTGPATWLRIINDLLAAIGYRGLWADENGYYRSEPHVAPAQRGSQWTFTVYGAGTQVADQRTLTKDDWSAPNKWVFVRRQTDTTPVEGDGIYTVTDAAGIARRGLTWPVIVELDAADQASLVTQGDARVAADKQVAASLAVTTSPFPPAGHYDIYTVVDPDVDLGGTFRVQGSTWELDLAGADMTHTWQVVS